MKKGPTENSARLAQLRKERGHTHADMLRVMGLTSNDFNRMAALGKIPELIDHYGKNVPPCPHVGAKAQKGRSALSALRRQYGHSLCQMLGFIDMAETRYRQMLAAGKVEEIIREYQTVLGQDPPAGQTTNVVLGWKVSRPKLPPVGAVLVRGEAKVKVLRHTGDDSVMVEWMDSEGRRRRAEWTTTPHPKSTDRGEWEAR